MNDKKFDDIIKNKLENLISGDSDESWSVFESKWDAEHVSSDLKTNEFDNLIKTKVGQHQQPYNSSHWHKIKEQLKTIEERKNTIFISKILEFAAIFLIVFTFLHLSSWMAFDKIQKTTSKAQFANIPTNKKSTSPVKNPDFDIDKQQLNRKINTRIENEPSITALLSLDVSDILDKNLHASLIENDINNIVDPRTSIITFQQQEFEAISKELSQEGFGMNTPQTEASNQDMMKTLATLPQNKIVAPESEMAMIFPMKYSQPDATTKYALSGYASADINLINTPFDKLYSLASYNKEALNNSYGINFSGKKGNLEIESGLGYAQREYQPKLVTEAYGQFADHYFEKSLHKISFDIANLPLNIKFHFINQSNWSAYIMAGAAINIILDAKYDINETLRRGTPPVAGRFTPEQARLDEKPFITGILNGDNFNDNYFASIGFGFGIEKKILGNTSMYIQPSYQRQIFSGDIGIGPNKDKIHTSSLQFGVKTVIN